MDCLRFSDSLHGRRSFCLALIFLDLVPLQDVVEAVGVDVGVGSPAATAHGVLRQDVFLALAPFEDHLRPVDLVAIAVAGMIHDISVHDAHGVAGVPAVDDHQDRERLVPQANETQALGFGLGIMEWRLEDALHLFLRQRIGTVADVVLPLVFFGYALQKIENARVVLVR